MATINFPWVREENNRHARSISLTLSRLSWEAPVNGTGNQMFPVFHVVADEEERQRIRALLPRKNGPVMEILDDNCLRYVGIEQSDDSDSRGVKYRYGLWGHHIELHPDDPAVLIHREDIEHVRQRKQMGSIQLKMPLCDEAVGLDGALEAPLRECISALGDRFTQDTVSLQDMLFDPFFLHSESRLYYHEPIDKQPDSAIFLHTEIKPELKVRQGGRLLSFKDQEIGNPVIALPDSYLNPRPVDGYGVLFGFDPQTLRLSEHKAPARYAHVAVPPNHHFQEDWWDGVFGLPIGKLLVHRSHEAWNMVFCVPRVVFSHAKRQRGVKPTYNRRAPVLLMVPVQVPHSRVKAMHHTFRGLPLSVQEAIWSVPGMSNALVQAIEKYQKLITKTPANLTRTTRLPYPMLIGAFAGSTSGVDVDSCTGRYRFGPYDVPPACITRASQKVQTLFERCGDNTLLTRKPLQLVAKNRIVLEEEEDVRKATPWQTALQQILPPQEVRVTRRLDL